MSVLYVYALLDGVRDGQTDLSGIADEPVRFLDCGAATAAVGFMPSAPELAADTLRGHDRTVRLIAERTEALLPGRFGSVLAGEAELRAFVAERAAALAEGFALVRGCAQMTLRFAAAGEAAEAAEAGPAGSQEPPVVAAEAGPGTRYLAARARARPDPRRDAGVAAVLGSVAHLVRSEKVEPHERPPLLATAHHLVPWGYLEAYARRARAAAEAAPAIHVSRSGPWPPYAFVPEGLA